MAQNLFCLLSIHIQRLLKTLSCWHVPDNSLLLIHIQCQLNVCGNLFAQFLRGRKLPLVAQAAQESHCYVCAVQVTVISYYVRLYANAGVVGVCRTCAYVSDRGICLIAYRCSGGIYAVGGSNLLFLGLDISSWETYLPAVLVTADYLAADGEGSCESLCSLFHPSLLYHVTNAR